MLDNTKNNKKIKVPVATLEKAIKMVNDTGKVISYLKVDVEGSELDAIPQWVKSGVLANVQQIGIELHTGPVSLKHGDIRLKFANLLRAFKAMKVKYNFQLVSYETNGCVDKRQDELTQRFYTYFDIVLFNPKSLL